MINIINKKDCCGCSACVQKCPKHCISLQEDNEGFLYPKVDVSSCIECGLCSKVCPIKKQNESRYPLKVYASKNKNDLIRLRSSSGGVFTLLAEQILSEGGIVFGAKFNKNWNVVHSYTDTIEGLGKFRGSKYVQSIIGNNFKIVENYLKEGRKVLFSGTSCQIAGLKNYLHKDYNDLLTIEIVCHGVPSPLIWRDYLKYKCLKNTKNVINRTNSVSELVEITNVSFRDKTKGWKNYCFRIDYSTNNSEVIRSKKDIFMRGFLKDLYLRPSCYSCVARQGKSGADISIADYWGIQLIHPEMDDNKGTGAILVYSEKGIRYYDLIKEKAETLEATYENVIIHNPCIVKSVDEPKIRSRFWIYYKEKNIDAIKEICDLMDPPMMVVLLSRIIRKIKLIIGT